MDSENLIPWIALTLLCRADTRAAWRVVRRSRELDLDLTDFFEMDADRRIAQFQDEVVEAILDNDIEEVWERAADAAPRMDENDVTVVRVIDDIYPRRFIDVAADAVPPVLYVAGDPGVLNRPALGIVGSRNATAEGLEYAWSLARTAVDRGLVVVSGGASGIDSAAHRGAVDADGTTIVTLPHGIDADASRRLIDKYPDNVTLVSQFPPGQRPAAETALARNRTIAGLSGAVVAVESGIVSGTMSTARHARRLSVPLFAVQWNDDLAAHQGTAKLLDTGAAPIPSQICLEDVFDSLFDVISTEPV